MRKETKRRLLELSTPLFLSIGVIVKALYTVAFAWWLDPWLHRKENQKLLDDVRSKLYFLGSASALDESHLRKGIPAAAEVHVVSRNLLFVFVRFRGDLTVSVAPRHAPAESYELSGVIPALENRHFSERDVMNTLDDIAKVLRFRLEFLNEAFSEQQFLETKQRLW